MTTKKELVWSGFGIPLAWLAELDNIPAPNALPDAFGDSYLYRYNPVFAAVRDAAIGFGYRFSVENTPLWRDYQALSLAALHRILSGKTIPYFDTGNTIRRLVESNPAVRLSQGFIFTNVKRNYSFHESAHCIAHFIMERMADPPTLAAGNAHRFVLESILAEAFANTVESLGSIVRHMPVSDAVFYGLNSYVARDQGREHVLNEARRELGAQRRFILLFLSHFEANLSVQAPTDSTYRRIAEAAGCVNHDGLPRKISEIGFRLSTVFRDTTTPAYFDLLGYSREYEALGNSEWLAQAQNRRFAREFGQMLWEAIGKV